MTIATLPQAAVRTTAALPPTAAAIPPLLPVTASAARAKRVEVSADIAAAAVPAIIVLGRDEADRPHASWFAADEAPLATKAAGLMEMATLRVEDDALSTLAAQMPHGRVFASGKAFVPFVRAATFDALTRHLPEGTTVPTRSSKPVPASGIAPSGDNDTPAGAAAKLAAPTASAPRGSLPEHWGKLKVGHRVLASVEKDDGWWPAIITEDNGDGLFTLEWQDWADWDPFLRKREQLALMHPSYSEA